MIFFLYELNDIKKIWDHFRATIKYKKIIYFFRKIVFNETKIVLTCFCINFDNQMDDNIGTPIFTISFIRV